MEHLPIERRLNALEIRVASLEAGRWQDGNRHWTESAAEIVPLAGDVLDTTWRRELDKWKSDLVAGLSVAAAELSTLQEEVGALENHLRTLQSSAPDLGRARKQIVIHGNENEPSLTSRVCRMESAMLLELHPMKSELFDLKSKCAIWMEDVAGRSQEASRLNREVAGRCEETFRQHTVLAADVTALEAKQATFMDTVTRSLNDSFVSSTSLTTDVQYLKSRVWFITEVSAKLDSKVDFGMWQEVNGDYDAHLRTLRDIFSEARSEFEAGRKRSEETFALHYKDIRKLLVRAQFCGDI